MKEKKCCGNCKYHEHDWTNPHNPDYYCGRKDGDNYGYSTDDVIKCEDWEAKK